MDNKKFETLIDLIINEQDEKARELFHEIVVDKSREIYESIMDEEVVEEAEAGEEAAEEAVEESMDEGDMVGEVGDLIDEISAEEAGMTEGEDEEVFDLDATDDEDAGEEGGEELEDRVVDLEDKLEQLMADFEEAMKGDDVGADMGDDEMEVDSEEEVEMMEAVQLQKVSVTHGDNGAQTKSPVTANSGAKGMDSKPVKFSGDHEAVPTGPKGPSNEYSKKEGDLPGAGSFKNVPGGKAKVDLSAAPKPVTKDGSANSKSPVAKG